MKSGEIWTASAGGVGYAGKRRPVIILQHKCFSDFNSVILCLVTSSNANAPYRVHILPSQENGLKRESWVMTEKIITIPKTNLGKKIGTLEPHYLVAIKQNVAKLLGIAD